jgi:hypothetical protein
MSTGIEVGWFEGRCPIIVRREPEVGLMWQAEGEHFGQGALGRTPEEAVKNLIVALNGRGIEGKGHSDTAKLRQLDETRAA